MLPPFWFYMSRAPSACNGNRQLHVAVAKLRQLCAIHDCRLPARSRTSSVSFASTLLAWKILQALIRFQETIEVPSASEAPYATVQAPAWVFC